MLLEIKLIKDLQSAILGLTELNEETIRAYFLEKLCELKSDIVSDIMDQNKFSMIANDIFINDIYPKLKK